MGAGTGEGWSRACEERLLRLPPPQLGPQGPFFRNLLAADEVCREGNRPIAAHPDLVVSRRYASYDSGNGMDLLVQVWAERDWQSVLDEIIAVLDYEIIDQFLLAVTVGQMRLRGERPPLKQMQGLVLSGGNLSWSPPLGRVRLAEFGGPVELGTGLVDVCAVNEASKQALLRTDNGSLVWYNYSGRSVHIQVDLREGDDFGSMAEHYALRYGMVPGSLSASLLTAEENMGSREAVRSRRPVAPAWLLDDAYFLSTAPRPPPGPGMARFFDENHNSEVSRLGGGGGGGGDFISCSTSRLARVMNLTATHPEDIESSRDGSNVRTDSTPLTEESPVPRESQGGGGGDGDGDGDGKEGGEHAFTIAMTTCRRLGHFLSVAKHVESFVFSYSDTLVTEVVVVDDGSSAQDRMDMLRIFPAFTFLFKSSGSRGHAASLNAIMRLVTSRFFLYLEDDWQLFTSPFLTSELLSAATGLSKQLPPHRRETAIVGADRLLHQLVGLSIRVIEGSLRPSNTSSLPEPVAQVFLNDQRSRVCAVGRVTPAVECSEEDHASCFCDVRDLGLGGWPRTAQSRRSEDATIIPYSLHEFGIYFEVIVMFECSNSMD